MESEKSKMLHGKLYDASDPLLTSERTIARLLLQQLNNLKATKVHRRKMILSQLLPNANEDIWIEPPFFCDYGYNIYAGKKVFLNFNCVMLDVTKVTIGDNVFFGPGVHLYAATHPTAFNQRNSGLEFGKPITIHSNVWIGGGTVICPGVTIGEGSVIGAGSVIVKNIPANILAAGNPCKWIKDLI